MKKTEEVTLLYEITKALSESLDLRKSLYKVLDILSTSMDMVRGTVAILNPLRNEIGIEVAHGMSRVAMERGKYQVGEGVTGRVIQTGKPFLVPKISQEPLFLNRTATRRRNASDQDLSYICVPVKKGSQVIGTLSVDRPYDKTYSLKEGERLLSIIATMIAQHVINLERIQLEKDQLREENRRLRDELSRKYQITNIVGTSNKMREVFQMISQVCRSNATALIRGESGTGKELVANAIGTIFLDEIGSVDMEVQVKLLRVLQEKEFERVGGYHTIKTDIRIIAATSKNLEESVEEETFRSDLYYRLNVFPIYMPPLRERKTDILLLADYFLEKYSKENQKDIRRLSTPAIDMLMQYHWPGNVRELENCIERAVQRNPWLT
jgi:Nif-specific regulatory protein